jgi:ethanolamine utilization protein EutP (predicted NTPase)
LKHSIRSLAAKPEIIILTKTDTVSPADVKEKIKIFKKSKKHVFNVTILDDESIKSLKDDLIKILRKI